MAAGSTAALSCSAGLSESALRNLLARVLPGDILELLDRVLLQGRLLLRALQRRQEANRLRQGGWPGVALALASGVEHAFDRSLRLEEARSLREAAPLPTSNDPPLILTDLDWMDAGRPRLQGISLTLEAGEWLAVIGASGSGKSSLFRVIAGLHAPTQGTLIRHGRDGRGRVDGATGLVFQDPEDQLLASTPLEDACWGLHRRGCSPEAARQRSQTWLARLGLTHAQDRPLHQLSFGERKRATLASILVLEPCLLLLDEPTSGLDPKASHILLDLLETEAAATTVLWATHDWLHLPQRVQRVLILEGGRMAFLGPRAEALHPDRLRAHGLIP